MSKKVLREVWPEIVTWLIKTLEREQDSGVPCAA
jgi:hypothetical protein